MRAIVRDGQSVQFSTSHPAPMPQDGHAIVRVRKAGVSATDVQVAHGLFDFNGVLGHEFVGVVESVSSPANGLVGRRVVGAIADRCGRCEMCLAGLRDHCRQRTLLGLRGRDGCFADRLAVRVENLVPVPDDVDDDRAVFAHVVASALQARRQLTIEGKPFITILGDGPLGLVTAQIMVRLNASVRVIGRYSQKLAICEKWGVKHRHADDIGRRADQDIVVECTGSPDGFALAARLVRPRGTIVLKTLHADWDRRQIGADLTPLVMNEINVIGSAHGPLGEALGVLQRHEVDVVSLIGRRMSLGDGVAILKAAAQPGALKVLVDVA